MPRGRKGTPQESIDSILLAMSRRDDIDLDTMSHYLDRLDEEWADGAREKVLHLLRSQDAQAQAAAIRILAELATDFDLEDLEDFVADPTVSDIAKLSLAPILKELGSEMADDGIVEYLNDPGGAIRQMQLRLLELVGQSEMGVETILDDVISMPVERRLSFISWLGNSEDPRAANLLVPLMENQSGKIAFAALDALGQLGPIALQQSIPALNHLIATSSNRQLKQNARAVLGRLTMQASLGIEDAATMEARQQQLPVHEARVSFIDGSGTQLIMLSWLRPDGLIKGINILYQDQTGIKDCYGVDEMDRERWNDLVHDLEEQGFSSFNVSIDYGRALIAEARSINKRTRRKLPIAYAIWRPLIEVGILAKKASPAPSAAAATPTISSLSAMSTMLPPLELDAETRELAQHSKELYQLPEFASWMYEPVERIEPYMTRYWVTYNLFESTPQNRKKKQKVKMVDKEAMLETLTSEALDEIIDDTWRARYEARLRRQAMLFQFAGRTQDVALLRAIAAMLHPQSGVAVKEQAFPRTMIRLSIEQGPLRMMVDAIEASDPGAFPVDFFDQE